MKKYHLADVCTALECVCAIIILGMSWYEVKPEYALSIFFVGQIFDAVDGPLARRYHYPNDNQRRWWREYAGLIDQLSDLLLGTTTCIYVMTCINHDVGISALVGATSVGIIVQTLAYDFPPFRLNWLKTRPELGNLIVLIRRWLYVGLIVFAVGLLLWSTRWPFAAKTTVTIIFCAIGLFLFVCKLNRLTEVKTKL